ncbi:MAG TPA: glycosyltransferase family A protein [Isosphaeraceae bacterium]|nr:glycosyltransferase family A protein [Isosphaeraceae bacterium]
MGWRVPAQSESASFSPQKEAPAPPHVSASGSGVVPWQLDAPLTSPSGKPSPTTDHRPRFCVVTPTIPGRERLLKAAIASVQAQDFRDLQHWVVGDGPCPEAESLCASLGVRFLHTPAREDAWGSNARNLVLDQADADYFVFLDDDNLLFRHSLARLHDTAAEHRDPPLLAQRILFLPRTAEPYRVLPESLPPQLGQWDQLCACVRGDIARQVRFQPHYTQDYVYIQDCIAASHVQPLLVEEIGGVHT